MDGHRHDAPPPPPRLYDRLRQIAGYTWDESIPPFHSTYDSWHVFGTRFVSSASLSSSSNTYNASSPGSASRLHSRQPASDQGGSLHADESQDGSITPGVAVTSLSAPGTELSYTEESVVARVSFHALREERTFHIASSLTNNADPDGDHIVRPLDLIRLTPVPGDRASIIVAIYEDIGHNCLYDVLDFGPAFYRAQRVDDTLVPYRNEAFSLGPPITLECFLDFAIGATQCLEIFHHDQGMIHGEIRGDAFHFSSNDNKVRIVSFGSGIRSFEHGLTSTGWSTLSKELGAKNKLLYISPEQTGRLPAEPDARTDIYSLGILLWSLLTQQPVFDGETPLDIVQGVLGRRIPNVSTVRMDVPDVIGRIIQKCTAKNIAERYLSASGLRHDLVEIQKYLGDGDVDALKDWKIGSKDISAFFILPTTMIGRQRERADILKVIDRVAKHHAMNLKAPSNRFSDASTVSTELATLDDLSSEGAVSLDGVDRRSALFTQALSSDTRQLRNSNTIPSVLSDTQTISNETVSSSQSGALPRQPQAWARHQSISIDTTSFIGSLGAEGSHTSMVEAATSSSISRQLGPGKFRRRGQCEVVAIEGAAGLGKSFLVESVLGDARRRGYCATAKFDTTRRTSFGPLLKLLSSLFKQVWGERNTETPFHQVLKQYIRPVWPMLHKILGLPEFLLGTQDAPGARSFPSYSSFVPRGNGLPSLPGPRRRGSSPSTSPGTSILSGNLTNQTSQDYLRNGASNKTMRLINTFLDVLRVFTNHKFVCFCLDDLQFADDESLELISQIIGSRLKMVIIVTYRPEEMSSQKMESILQPSASDEFARANAPHLTKISLSPLSEENIVTYVSQTLSRSREDILSLALVIQSKTAGNPFYMREMLGACYRKKCIWYDYRDSQWHYDLDRLFDQFQGEKDYDVLDTGFVTRRLNELPVASRAILAWAALLGSSFSFDVICRLLGGEFEYDDEEWAACTSDFPQKGFSKEEAVNGLQAGIQACIIVPSESDDRFRFAHTRYVQASAALKECNAKRMHFIIAQTLLKHYAAEARQMDSTAAHICEASELIRARVAIRQPFRELLMDCAQMSTENGARQTAVKYYQTAVMLLQDEPWSGTVEDSSYEETMQLYLRYAECQLFMGQHTTATEILRIVFSKAKTAFDKAPAYVFQARIFSQNGDAGAALVSLKECLGMLGVKLDSDPTFEKCDKKFKTVSAKIRKMDRAALLNPTPNQVHDATLASLGAVLSETIGAAWWSDCVRFYHLTLALLEMHLTKGVFPQSGMAFLWLGTIALTRFKDAHFAVELGTIAMDLLLQANDSFAMARGFILYSCFIGHIHCSMPTTMSQNEDAVELAGIAGDRMTIILSYGLSSLTRFFASQNYADLEGFSNYCCEEIPKWFLDARGGTMLISVRQICRAMQGKTRTKNPLEVMSDEHHDATPYKSWLSSRTAHTNRSVLLYESVEIVPLFLYGHYDRAIEIGQRCVDKLSMLWSAQNSRLVLLFYGLALTGRLLRRMQDPRTSTDEFSGEVEAVIKDLRSFIKDIEDWGAVSNVNYLCWSKMLEAQVSELQGDHGATVQNYEELLDHATEHDFVFEEAVGQYLTAGFFFRRKARRSARAALLEAIGLYRQLSAFGVTKAIEEEHSLLLHGPTRNHRTSEAAVQTDFVADTTSVQYRPVDVGDGEPLAMIPSNTLTDTRGDRIGAWRGSMNMQASAGAGLPALDMIDLHAILVSSQVISSVLQVDDLLKTMCDVILQTCGGSASMAAIVVQEPDADSWCIAASGNPENGARAHNPGLPLSGTSLIAENVVFYCTRFLETVFIPDVIADERFGNVADSWLQRCPLGKAIIAIPISHGTKSILGVLYLEGEPGTFTDRNVTVLQLLVNQIGISYSNALSMKNLEKISAENRSMVTVQKRALAKALEAETKAKDAEAEAKRNVKLAEEAVKAKSIFLANVSHELRTPLNGVIGNSELLRDSSLKREQMEMADSIRVSADLLLTVINDILDFSKMEADKMKLYVIAFNPEEMVREVVRAVSYSNREKTSKKNVKIIQDINLPSVLIYGDPIRLHQVLGNLIGNSLKFTEYGSITIGARLDLDSKEQATLTFWVRDTGIGIPSQQLVKLFQPFSQADASTARKYGGSGLGLSICKSLIETMMHGKIQLESEENVGTTAWFTVSFEKAKADVSAGDAQSKSSPPIDRYSAPTSPFERGASPTPYLDLSQLAKKDIRICVAEDNPINQKIAIQFVQRLGFSNVDAYDNGQKAVEGLRQKASEGQPYHVVLMDVQMPVLDGYEATKTIRKDPIEAVRKTLVIAMTASAIQGDREKCLAAGMNDYLAKPVRSEVLRKKLEAYMSPVVAPAEPTLLAPKPISSSKALPNGYSAVAPSLSLSVSSQESQPQDILISDPVRDEAIFNQPIDSIALRAADSPIYAGTPEDQGAPIPIRENAAYSRTTPSIVTPSRSSSESRASESGLTLDGAASQVQKRPPRKLTKSRGAGESSHERPVAEKAGADRPSGEKLRGVLTKKPPQGQSTRGITEDGVDGQDGPPGAQR